jgi:hypothetical protein
VYFRICENGNEKRFLNSFSEIFLNNLRILWKAVKNLSISEVSLCFNCFNCFKIYFDKCIGVKCVTFNVVMVNTLLLSEYKMYFKSNIIKGYSILITHYSLTKRNKSNKDQKVSYLIKSI